MEMLLSHMAAVERSLLQTAKIPASAGHSLHKGTPRETFIKQFLQDHLTETIAIGQGEIIAANSRSGDRRSQFDNLPLSFVPPDQQRQHPALTYYVGDMPEATLLAFFLFLTFANFGIFGEVPNLTAYLPSVPGQVQF